MQPLSWCKDEREDEQTFTLVLFWKGIRTIKAERKLHFCLACLSVSRSHSLLLSLAVGSVKIIFSGIYQFSVFLNSSSWVTAVILGCLINTVFLVKAGCCRTKNTLHLSCKTVNKMINCTLLMDYRCVELMKYTLADTWFLKLTPLLIFLRI